jgi:hypothetical protein
MGSELSAEELTLWRICSSAVLQQYLEKSGRLGQEVMRAYGRIRSAPDCRSVSVMIMLATAPATSLPVSSNRPFPHGSPVHSHLWRLFGINSRPDGIVQFADAGRDAGAPP